VSTGCGFGGRPSSAAGLVGLPLALITLLRRRWRRWR
jgi:hypothetical protein